MHDGIRIRVFSFIPVVETLASMKWLAVFCVVCFFASATAHHAAEKDISIADLAYEFDLCRFCKNATIVVDQALLWKEKRIKSIAGLAKSGCEGLPNATIDYCHRFAEKVDGLFAFVYATAERSVEGLCEGVFACPPETKYLMTENGIFETTCAICQRTMAGILKRMSDERVTKASAQAIATICQSAGRIMKPEDCAKRYLAILQQTYGTTLKYLHPDVFCVAARVCSREILTPPPEAEAVAPGEDQLEMKTTKPVV